MREKIEQLVLLSIAILSIVLSVADLFGLLDRISWLSANIPSITLALLGTIAVYLVLERRSKLDEIQKSVNSLDSKFSQVNAFFGAFRIRDHFSEIALIYELRREGKLTSDNALFVERNKVLNLWRDCMAGSKRWLAVTYTKQEVSWDTGWGNAIAQGIQTERISAGGTIKRVFVLDSLDELEYMRKIIEDHKKIRVDVRWILKSDLLKNQLVAERIKSIGTLDVSIVDDSWILRVFLDNKRQYTSAEVNKERELVEKAAFIFAEAFEAGKPI